MLTHQYTNPHSVPGRTVFIDERHCCNCHMYNRCWSMDILIDEDILKENMIPGFFENKNDWPNLRLLRHMQGIYAQICNRFSPNSPEQYARFEASQFRKSDKEWDI